MRGVNFLSVFCCCPLSSFPWLLDIRQAAMRSHLHSLLTRAGASILTQLTSCWQLRFSLIVVLRIES